uniref:Uncharacterized protein n=1 Tax=Tetraselmis sp. GSL018 TaxID=582737 RepID=A0A061SJF9_9CHLO
MGVDAREDMDSLEARLQDARAAVQARCSEAGKSLGHSRLQANTQNLDASLAELEILFAGQHLAQATLKMQQRLKELETSVRELNQLDHEESLPGAFDELARRAVGISSSVASLRSSLHPLLSRAAPRGLEELADHATAVSGRLEDVLGLLRGVLSSAFSARLLEAGWPPALGDPPGKLESSGADLLDALWGLAGLLVEAQRGSEPRAFEKDSALPRPRLWVAQLLLEPLEQRLRFHFAGGKETARVDKPEWMFSHALRLAKEAAPEAAALNGAVQERGLPEGYSLPVEIAEGIREAVRGTLASHYLPALLELSRPELWLHLVDEALSFEKELAPLRWEPDLDDEEVFLGPPAWADDSCLNALVSDSRFMAAWEKAELEEARRQMDEATAGEGCWVGAGAEWERSSTAWKAEFWPSAAAEGALGVLRALLKRAACLPAPEAPASFCAHVVAPAAAGFSGALERLAEMFQDLSSEAWAPNVAGACCAAHYLDHHLRELAPLCLPDGPGRGAVEQTAARFAAFSRKWALKLAASVTQRLLEAAGPYRSAAATFASEGDPSAGGGPAEMSRLWAPVVQQLQETLHRLSGMLDSVVFREVWRAVAAAVNQILYNDIATEAQFSREGAERFAADCKAIVSVFKPFAPRPGAHFKELREACKLLLLGEDEAEALEAALDGGEAGGEGPAGMLRALGIRCLNADQAECVLGQRLW